MDKMDLVPCLQAGARFGKLCFSHDARYLFCCCGSHVKVYNTINGECLHDLKAHVKPVTGVHLNPNNKLQLVSCGQDGQLIFWDYLDGVKLKVHDLHMGLYGIVSMNPDTKSIMIIADTSAQKTSSSSSFSLMQWKRKSSNPNQFSKPKTLIEKCDSDSGLISFGCDREFVASASGYQLTIYAMKKDTKRIVHDNDKFNKKVPITCVACHPNEYIIAAGLENGKIILWHNFFLGNEPVIARLHWHNLSVRCLAFTPDGSHLLSGGSECVLVKWQMGNTDMKDFKPRMGAPLTQILSSPDGSFYATQHADNVVQLMNVGKKVLQVYRGLTRGSLGVVKADKSCIPCGLKYDPRSQALVMNGLPGHLQFYSLALNRQLFNLDIVGQNFISPEEADTPKVITEIIASAISDTGEWLATFESWDDGHFTPEQRLKFWVWSSEAQTYVLNTTVESPHDGIIKTMVFRPSCYSTSVNSAFLVTVGSDNCFKLWRLVDDTDIYRTNTRWDCDSVGFYKGLEAMCADFSKDGTALAVGFEHLVTLWDPDNNIVQATVSNSLPEKHAISHIKFGNKQSSYHLVISTGKNLLVWDLRTLSIVWKREADISLLFSDPGSDLMAFITTEGSLNVFSPTNPEIYHQQTVTLSDKAKTSVLDAVFIPNGRHEDIANFGWPGTSQIYMFNSDEELLTLDLPSKQLNSSNKVKINQNLPQSALSAFLAEKLVREEDEEEKIPLNSRHKVDDDFLSALLHSNEPVSMQCDQFLKTLLIKSSKQDTSTNGVDDEDDSESDMETDERDSQPLPSSMKKVVLSPQVTPKKVEKEEDMNKLLASSLDWIQWCADLKLK